MRSFHKELTDLVNRHRVDSITNIPDDLLAFVELEIER